MIISHKHRFIYVKPTKVAGTSVEVALAGVCGDEDVVTPQREFSSSLDIDAYHQRARNYDGFTQHMLPEEIRARVGDDIWNAYLKIAVIRNPWDYIVSRFLWEYTKMYQADRYRTLSLQFKHILLRGWFRFVRRQYIYSIFSFESFTRAIPEGFINERYYFDENGAPYCDIFLRYERLQADYDALCGMLGVPVSQLPRINAKHIKKRRPYRSFYNDATMHRVAVRCAKEIEYFGYTFDGPRVSVAPSGDAATGHR